jgi:2-dehydropantoate 2-reductase
MFEPGKVKRSTPRARTWFGIGALDPSMASRVPEIEALLKNVGRVSLNDNILSAKWIKLVVNAMVMSQTLLGLNGIAAIKLPGMRDIMLKCGEEALHAGQSQSYTVEPIFGLTQEDVEGSNRLLELLLDKVLTDVGPTAIDMVRQDHIKGRYSEVDLINGKVVEENAKRGRASPANEMVVALTKRIHAGELTLDPANLDLARQVLEQ